MQANEMLRALRAIRRLHRGRIRRVGVPVAKVRHRQNSGYSGRYSMIIRLRRRSPARNKLVYIRRITTKLHSAGKTRNWRRFKPFFY